MPVLSEVVAQNARRRGDLEAVVHGDIRWTWRDLNGHVETAATALQARGLRAGDRFAILADNSAHYVAAVYGALRLGAIIVPIGSRLAAPEVAHVLTDSGARLVAAAEGACGNVLAAALVGVTSIDVVSLADLFSVPSELPRRPVVHEADDAFITYTSGTTGRPKGVLIDHHRAIWAALAQVTSLGLRDGERYLHLSPFYHSGGVVFLNAVTLLAGTHVVAPVFEAATVLDLLEQERITTFLGVPTMYQLLLAQPDIDRRRLPDWRTGVFGAAQMPRRTVETLLELFPHVSLFQLCGQTEAGPAGLYSTTAQLRARPDSTGHQTQPGLECRIVDNDGMDVLAPGTGELLFRGETVMKGYWRSPTETAGTVREGWLHTGDVVRVDPDGTMLLVDRLKDVIITGGQNVYSAEVESVVGMHPSVADCAVIGVPHERYGETVVAVVTTLEGASLSLDELRAHCAGHLARYKIPRALQIGPVPRSATGKLQKHLLRGRAASREDRRT